MERTDGTTREVGIGKARAIRLSENAWQGFTRVLDLAYCLAPSPARWSDRCSRSSPGEAAQALSRPRS